ncbi:MAG: glycine zipper 2TM domain-containing protein [Burkholderiales bacterium]
MSTPAANGATSRQGLHPGIVVGAIAVVVFGAAGAASYLGLLPGQAANAPATPMSVVKPAQQAGLVPDAVVPPAPAPAPVESAPPPAPVAATPAPQPAPAVAPAPKPEAPPAPPKPRVAKPAPAPAPAARPAPSAPAYASGAPAYASAPPAAAAPEPAPAPKICRNCGTVSEIVPIQKKGDSSGAGAVLGGIVGGVLGHQVGGGRGKDVATVAGALGGALVGNEIEKNRASVTAWDVRVRLEDGTNKVVRYTSEPSWRVGDKVRVEEGRIVSASRP